MDTITKPNKNCKTGTSRPGVARVNSPCTTELAAIKQCRNGSRKAFEVIVGRGLECSRENSRRDGVVELVRQFADYVETLTLQHPTSCLVWSSLHSEESRQ